MESDSKTPANDRGPLARSALQVKLGKFVLFFAAICAVLFWLAWKQNSALDVYVADATFAGFFAALFAFGETEEARERQVGRPFWRRAATAAGGLLLHWLLLLALMFLPSLIFGFDEAVLVMTALFAVLAAPLVAYRKAIVGPGFPYLRRGFVWVALFGVPASFFLIGLYRQGDDVLQHLMRLASWMALYLPVVAVVTLVFGWVAAQADALWAKVRPGNGR